MIEFVNSIILIKQSITARVEVVSRQYKQHHCSSRGVLRRPRTSAIQWRMPIHRRRLVDEREKPPSRDVRKGSYDNALKHVIRSAESPHQSPVIRRAMARTLNRLKVRPVLPSLDDFHHRRR